MMQCFSTLKTWMRTKKNCGNQRLKNPKVIKETLPFPNRVDVILLHSDITKTNKVLQET